MNLWCNFFFVILCLIHVFLSLILTPILFNSQHTYTYHTYIQIDDAILVYHRSCDSDYKYLDMECDLEELIRDGSLTFDKWVPHLNPTLCHYSKKDGWFGCLAHNYTCIRVTIVHCCLCSLQNVSCTNMQLHYDYVCNVYSTV